MGYCLREDGLHQLFEMWNRDYVVYGPKCMAGEGMYSDTDVVRYGRLKRFEELEWETKSAYSFKEAILPITQILFYFTEGEVKEAEPERKKPALLFMRSCDIHALKRLDAVYLENHFGDSYYARLRKGLRLVLLGCSKSCDNGFCVSMGTNQTEEYDAAMNIKKVDGQVRAEITGTMDGLEGLLDGLGADRTEAGPDFVSENHVKVRIPEECGPEHVKAGLWKDYDSRCIGCGRCNFACPTCTCFTMQDIFYQDNERAGERRRVHASCMVDGYTDVAGGGCYRDSKGERMRFKVLHKISDFKKQFGYQMCVGCGRCDDICPEYISFSACVTRLADMGNADPACGDQARRNQGNRVREGVCAGAGNTKKEVR